MADRKTAIAIFDDRTQAQRAIEQLKRAGFTENEIGVTARDAGDSDRGVAGVGDGRKETHAKEGAIAGVATGAGVGALWGLGILAGVLPAIGPAIAGGTLAALLSSAAAGAGSSVKSGWSARVRRGWARRISGPSAATFAANSPRCAGSKDCASSK